MSDHLVYSDEATRSLQNIRMIWIGQDLFIEKIDAHVEEDIQQELRDVADEPE